VQEQQVAGATRLKYSTNSLRFVADNKITGLNLIPNNYTPT